MTVTASAFAQQQGITANQKAPAVQAGFSGGLTQALSQTAPHKVSTRPHTLSSSETATSATRAAIEQSTIIHTKNPYREQGLPDEVYSQFTQAMTTLGYGIGNPLETNAGLVEGVMTFSLIMRAQAAEQSLATTGSIDPSRPIRNPERIDWTQIFQEIAKEAENSLTKERVNEAKGWFIKSTKSPHHKTFYLSDAQKQAWIQYEAEQYITRGNMIVEIGNYMAENYASKG